MSRTSREEQVWRALSNPTRRKMLDLLRDGPLTTGALAKRFRRLSRFAVMQHLSVLEEARLVIVKRDGRERFNHLNAVPIQRIHERWVSRFAADAATSLLDIGRAAEQRGARMSSSTIRSVKIHNELDVDAPREVVWDTLVHRETDWFPYTYGEDKLKRIVVEPRVGGLHYEDWGDGAGILYGQIYYYDEPHRFGTRGHLGGAVNLETMYTLTENDQGTVLTQVMTAFGDMSNEMAESIRSHGDISLFIDRFREVCTEAAATA